MVRRAEKEIHYLTTRLQNMEMRTEKSKHMLSNCQDVKVDIMRNNSRKSTHASTWVQSSLLLLMEDLTNE